MGSASTTKLTASDFERLVIEQLGALHALGLRLTRNPTEAEDLVQDTVIKAFRARDQYRTGTNLRAWLMKILKNNFINKFRRGGLERRTLEGPTADPLLEGWVGRTTLRSMRDPEGRALEPLIAAEIMGVVDALPEEFRLVVLLADVEELSYREIADVMDCPIGTVMSRLHRGRAALKKHLVEQAEVMGVIEPRPSGPAAREAPPRLDDYRRKKARP